jgi:golgin subfamily B member 1
MKKIVAGFGILAVFAATNVMAETPDFSQDAERNRELLGIWKDHVKTLTKERDDAYRQLEQMKMSRGAAPAGQFGVETMPLANPMQAEQIAGLQTEIGRLQTELQKKASGDPNRELQMRASALQTQLAQVKKDLNDTRSEKDRLIQEKERALSQVERLESTGGPAVRTERDTRDLDRIRDLENQLRESQAETNAIKQQNSRITGGDPSDTAVRQAREMQYENETLKAQIEKLQVVEKELSSTRSYFTPLVKDLQEKNDRLTAEISTLRSDYAHQKSQAGEIESQLRSIRTQTEQSQKDAENLQTEADALKTQNQRLEADLRTVQSERDDLTAANANYKSQLQMANADREKYRGLEESLKGLREQHESLQKGYAVLEENARNSTAELNRMSSQTASMQSASRERDKYKTALAANLNDMKNLKSNFEAYLESLVASFEDRSR